MELPRCWSCNNNFKWKESVVYFFGHKTCSNCGEKQYITTESNKKVGIFGAPLSLIPFVFNGFGVNWIFTGLITFLAIIIYIAFIPYKLEFTEDRQPLF